MSIRVERTENVPALAALRRAWVEENAGAPIDDPAFEPWFGAWWGTEAAHRTAWVVYEHDEPVGMLNLAEFHRMPRPGMRPTAWGYIGNVFVLGAHRNRGAGTALLAAAIAEARRRRYVRLVLSPSERSVPLYRRAGFRGAEELLVLPLAGD